MFAYVSALGLPYYGLFAVVVSSWVQCGISTVIGMSSLGIDILCVRGCLHYFVCSLPSLGYEDAVKVCSSCYALVEDNFSPPS